ncbi:MAG: DMT family transporter [Promethearchaeota archaeon]|nr:MAG: DMT family transporter [Candidatus Lokiarchaeota archaeon]
MVKNKKALEKGLVFGIIASLLIGLQPIVANARPEFIDPYVFSILTLFFEAVIFFPIMLIQGYLYKAKYENNVISKEELESFLNGYKHNKLRLFYVGITFGVGQILFFIGYTLAGSINGALAQKSTIFFSLLFSYLILNEKITKIQIIFSTFLFFGLILAVTQGTFNLLELNMGVIVLLFLASIWMLAHTLTKPIFNRKEGYPSQIVFIRNIIGAIILFFIFLILFPVELITMLSNPIVIFWGFLMGGTYGIGLYFWYNTLKYLDVAKANILVSPTPIVTTIFASIFLGEIFTIFHLIGMVIVIVSIIIIMKEK